MAVSATQAMTKAQYFKTSCSPYTKKGFDRFQRHWSYVNSGGTAPLLHKMSGATFMFMGAVKGGIYGAKVGCATGQAISMNAKAIQLSTGLGFTIGASIGAGGALYVYINVTERLPYHNEWKEKQIDKVLKNAVILDNSNDVVLKEFTCPLGLVVMDWPCRTPTGHSYEKMEILKYRAGTNTISDPMRNRVFDETELLEDYEAAFIINKRTVYLLKAYNEQLSNDIDVKKGISNLLTEFQELAAFAFEDAKGELEKRRIASGDVNRYMTELQGFFNTFGNTPSEDIDWLVNWKAKLDKRWQYFNPEAVILEQ